MSLNNSDLTLNPTALKEDVEGKLVLLNGEIGQLRRDNATLTNSGGNLEVINARSGMPTLSDRLDKIYNFLPIVSYESYDDAPSNAITFYKISMSWKGKVYYFSHVNFDFNFIHTTETAVSKYLSVICWDILNHVFVHKLYSELTAQFMPIFQIYGRNFHEKCVVFFDQAFNYVDCSSGEIVKKICFAWPPASSENNKNDLFASPIIDKIENSVVDLMGLYIMISRSGTSTNNPYITINNSIIKNYNPQPYWGGGVQFRYNPDYFGTLKISGKGNDIEMIRTCPGEFINPRGNTLRIPYDTDDYWKIYKKNQTNSVVSYINNDGFAIYKPFTLLIGGYKVKNVGLVSSKFGFPPSEFTMVIPPGSKYLGFNGKIDYNFSGYDRSISLESDALYIIREGDIYSKTDSYPIGGTITGNRSATVTFRIELKDGSSGSELGQIVLKIIVSGDVSSIYTSLMSIQTYNDL